MRDCAVAVTTCKPAQKPDRSARRKVKSGKCKDKLGKHQSLASIDAEGESASSRDMAFTAWPCCTTTALLVAVSLGIVAGVGTVTRSLLFDIHGTVQLPPLEPPPQRPPAHPPPCNPPPALPPSSPPLAPPRYPSPPIAPPSMQPPLLGYVMKGCSGSTFIGNTLSELLRCSVRWQVLHKDEWNGWLDPELLKSEKNPWYAQVALEMTNASEAQRWNATLWRMWHFARGSGASIIINADSSRSRATLEDREVRDTLHRFGLRFVHLWRSNVLDHRTCAVKDCFAHFGDNYNVYHGERSQLCFARRHIPDPHEYRAHLDTAGLADTLRGDIQATASDHERLQPGELAPFRLLEYETFVRVQYPHANTTCDFDAGVDEWHALLSLMGAGVSRDVVSRCLAPRVGTYHRPGPHTDVLDNYDEVEAALCSTPLDRSTVCSLIRR